MKRTTLVLDTGQFTELKKLAAAERRTLSSVTEELIRLGIGARRRHKPRRKLRLPSWKMGRFRADVADRKALYEAMEGR